MRRILSNTLGVLLGAVILLSGGTSFAGWADKIDEWYSSPVKSVELETMDETVDYTYVNLIDLDRYIAALEDSRVDVETYKNLITLDQYIAAIEDPLDHQVEFMNVMTLGRYIDSLGDRAEDMVVKDALRQVEFSNTISLERYIANLADRCNWDSSTPESFVVAQCEVK